MNTSVALMALLHIANLVLNVVTMILVVKVGISTVNVLRSFREELNVVEGEDADDPD